MGAESTQYELPAELDTYLQDSIFHMLGFCSSEEQLKKKLSKAEASHRDLALQLHHMQLRMRELEHKRSKSKEEAVLNAQALKRQVAENQKLLEQFKAMKDECIRLEQECDLYHNDRDVFMEAAYEAEDRAAEAEDRATEAEKKTATAVMELDRLRIELAQASRGRLEMDPTECVTSMRARIAELERENSSIQEELALLRSRFKVHPSAVPTDVLRVPEDMDLEARLIASNEKFEETRRELMTLQEMYANEVASKEAEEAVHHLVTSAITSGICKAVEAEKEATISALNVEFSSLLRCMESELCGSRERAKFAEMNVQALLLELQATRQEAAICRNNLDKAEVEVQMLADENKEVRILLRRRYADFDSPMQTKGNSGGSSRSRGKSRIKPFEAHGEESLCELCKARQPLMPLSLNAVERKVTRRQNLAVDGNFCSRSPTSPSIDGSPGSIFQD